MNKVTRIKNYQKLKKYTCRFCNHNFLYEVNFIKHGCKFKKRYLCRNDVDFRIGFISYTVFLKRIGRYNKNTNVMSYIKNRAFTSFNNYGKYIQKFNIVEPEKYLKYLLDNSIDINKWINYEISSKYIMYRSKGEEAEAAVFRTLIFIQKEAVKLSFEWNKFFKIELFRIVNYIRSGNISPWLLYNCSSGRKIIEKIKLLNDKSLDILLDYDGFWKSKFARYKMECVAIKQVLEEWEL